jgi:hypothetical protein
MHLIDFWHQHGARRNKVTKKEKIARVRAAMDHAASRIDFVKGNPEGFASWDLMATHLARRDAGEDSPYTDAQVHNAAVSLVEQLEIPFVYLYGFVREHI